MPQWLQDWPVPVIFIAGVLGSAARSQATYWIGRGVAAKLLGARWSHRLDGPRTKRAIASIERWGMPIVPLSFLTIGFQTAINGAAGLIRIHWLRYTLWAVPGWILWSLLWTGVGFAAVIGALSLAARSPWALVGAILVVVAVVTFVVLRLRRRRAAVGAEDTDDDSSPSEGTADAEDA